MSTQRYTVTPHPIETLLTWVKSGEIAIPEIQRPFVWEATKVRNLLDSLYRGYPVGYLIAWRNPSVKLKDGSSSAGKRVLIDGQQRVTALMAALLGQQVVTKDYEQVRIRIAFNPLEEKFEVSNPAITKNTAWITDVGEVFAPGARLFDLVNAYCARNPGTDQGTVFQIIEKLRKITNNLVGVIELDGDLDIETVTEIFIRVNSAGAELSQADFAMSKIASNESYCGNTLRKAIDYFCHLAVAPEFYGKIKENDTAFASTNFFKKMEWLKNENDDIYDPSYTDMLRVAFTSEFKRGKLSDLVALLSGRNFETKQFEDSIAEQSFGRLKLGVMNFINETHFKRFVMIIRSAGFVDASLIGSQNALNFAYILYLTLRAQGKPPADIETAVRKWFVMSMLTGRYSGSPESTIDFDIRQMHDQGFDAYGTVTFAGEMSDAFWDTLLPQQMNTSSSSSPYFRVFQAAQVKLGDHGFLSRDISVRDLILNKSDVHHLYPRNHLKGQGLNRGRYNQIANYALTQTEINIAIGDKSPEIYFRQIIEQCDGGKKKFGGITSLAELKTNFVENCIPQSMMSANVPDYDSFLEERRGLMASKLKTYFHAL
ncbi:MAG: GmrSD restriction endonuclease domain-containing protein [Pseudomonadota bacterium]